MKKLLFALLATVAVTPAMAQDWGYTQGRAAAPQQRTYQQQAARPVQVRQVEQKTTADYKLGNPLYHPAAGQVVLGANALYHYTPKEESIGQAKVNGWEVTPEFEVGLTKKLSLLGSVTYGQSKVKSDAGTTGEIYPVGAGLKGHKDDVYGAEFGLRYLLASADGFDVNVNASLYYEKNRLDSKAAQWPKNSRKTGTDIALQVGKKIENITPYFTAGFVTDFWSKTGDESGTEMYINPGVYIDMTDCLSLDLSYTSVLGENAMYKASLDVYPTDNVLLSFGGFIYHPETHMDTYGAIAKVKFAF